MARNAKSRTYPSYNLNGPLNVRIMQGLQDGLFVGAAREVATAISSDWHRTAWAPAARLAEAARCDKALLSRFIRQIGYDNYVEFQRAAIAVVNGSSEATASDEFPETEWLQQQMTGLNRNQFEYIQAQAPQDLEELADQVKHVSWLIARAQRILITAATPGALKFVAAVSAVFAASSEVPVIDMREGENHHLSKDDHLIFLHVQDTDGAETSDGVALLDWACPDYSKTKRLHIVVNGDPVTRTSLRRVLDLHDGSDPIAAIAVALNICCVVAREAAKRKKQMEK